MFQDGRLAAHPIAMEETAEYIKDMALQLAELARVAGYFRSCAFLILASDELETNRSGELAQSKIFTAVPAA